MQSSTPKFTQKLQEILKDLVPHTRECKWAGEHQYCEKTFEIVKEDIEFLHLLQVPPPNFCPTCRRMRRLPPMNMVRLFKRDCNAPEHGEKIISILPEECPFPVYDYKYFISDDFDPFLFGTDFVEGVSPLEQLFALRQKFPMPSFFNRDPSSVNSDYSNGGRNLKNGYYAMGCYDAENVWYSSWANSSKDIMDSRAVTNSEYVYSSLHVDKIYKSSFIYFSKECTDSLFLFDCINSTNCFGCVNLRNAKYCVYNEQLTKEGYNEFIDSIYPLSRATIKECEEKFWNLVKSLPLNGSRNVASERVSGVLLNRTKNAYDVSDGDKSEHVRYCDGAFSHKDSMDILFSGAHSSLLYGTTNVGSQSSGVRFSVSNKFCTDSEYIFNSKNLKNCFMCFGLQNKSYCILNKQYEKEEYLKLVDEIKADMLARGEYADGLGFEFSAQAYNFSLGQISYPLPNETIVKLGGYVAKEPETNVGSLNVLKKGEVPQIIDKVTDEILNNAIECEITNKPFRIIQPELEFYRKMKLPLPSTHPVVRMEHHLKLAPIAKKHNAHCAKCDVAINSLFNPDSNFILYCEKCYQQEVV